MKVPPEQTQAPADELVSYEDFLLRLNQLSSSPRVRVKKLGESHGGRGLYVILVASEDAIARLEHHRVLSTALHMPEVAHRSLARIEISERPAMAPDVRFPALITGLSFGHEASHVEAHLALADRLAWGDDDEVEAILSQLVVLIMPMMNPDGREMSIEMWRQYPLTEDSSAGNLYGFYLNRDFLHLTQPEARAVADVYREWHPIALLDTHEDVYSLGVQVPEACWCPHSGHSPVEVAPDNILDLITQLGKAIQEEWARNGYKSLEQNMFAHPMPGQPEDSPAWIASGNVVETMNLHGIPSVITESGRTPGVQLWEDRIQQKYLAGMALLKEVAKTPAEIAETVYQNRKGVMKGDHRVTEAFIIAKEQRELGALAGLMDTLLQQGILVYETEAPYPAYVVPSAQAEYEVARTLLSAPSSHLAAMGPALGVAIAPLESLSKNDQSALNNAKLRRVLAPPLPALRFPVKPDTRQYAIPNSTDGIKLVNRLWGLGSDVRRLSRPVDASTGEMENGTFLVSDVSAEALKTLGRGLALELGVSPTATKTEGYLLRMPKVALYTGQGVDRPDASARGDVWWALERLGFQFAPLAAEDINEDTLARYDILIVSDGDAQEIVQGWDVHALLNTTPWELPGEPRGIGQQGIGALRNYVEAGGHYLGFGSGGGLLASSQYADLIALEVLAHSLGSARVLLRVEEAAHPLLLGLNGYYDEDGTWTEGYFPAQYQAASFTDTPGGPVFRAGKDCSTLASYYQVDCDQASPYVVNGQYLTETEGGVAIAAQTVGQGQVAVVGVRAGFRALWTNTWKLLSNAIFLAAAGKH